MLHTIMIVVHASAGVVAFVAGCVALRRSEVFPVYFVAMIVMVATLAVAVIADWGEIDGVTRVIFAGLLVLAAFMMLQAERARRLDAADPDVAVARFRHIGFTLVGLAVAYLVIQVLGGNAPGWLAFGVALAASLGGHFVLVAVEPRATRRPAASVR